MLFKLLISIALPQEPPRVYGLRNTTRFFYRTPLLLPIEPERLMHDPSRMPMSTEETTFGGACIDLIDSIESRMLMFLSFTRVCLWGRS